ncbi:MAG: 4-(cytidine 5'-diphospho)-2-C-methyl-D-erythritol kinase, partial [Clostridiales bacterium]|nr:4-(cytidine 5'-diphospho)-2-C-methyl-D-erythritol kinase [Clostridiales bacterium]
MINSITVYACGKINLYLNVLSKLPDGYHTVDNVMQAVSLHDTLSLSPKSDGISIDCSDPSIPPSENLAYRAAELFYRRFPDIHAGLHIDLKKNIPVSAGLAGGSSDAAAVLVGMNLMYGTKLSDDELCGLATMLGMDVPFCVMGGCRRASGRGEILSPLPNMPKCLILIAIGTERISTAWAYRQ